MMEKDEIEGQMLSKCWVEVEENPEGVSRIYRWERVKDTKELKKGETDEKG